MAAATRFGTAGSFRYDHWERGGGVDGTAVHVVTSVAAYSSVRAHTICIRLLLASMLNAGQVPIPDSETGRDRFLPGPSHVTFPLVFLSAVHSAF
jgi:hypothetical protein